MKEITLLMVANRENELSIERVYRARFQNFYKN